ncbi:hypothetical protein LJC74_08565, partial [Eubacteriales bacterium OttesenSCG-928-A19]|nr:hypothetical protein [Eubacteriales bacterium OttesenSCG-928-A19]
MNPAPELFLLRDDAGMILYAPLRGLAARINEAAAGVVGRFLLGEAIVGEEARVVRMLKAHGFFVPVDGLHDPDEGFA